MLHITCFFLVALLNIDPSYASQKVQPSNLENSPMQFAVHDGVRLAYRTYGSSEGPALVVLNGVGSATRFDEDALTHALVDEGFHVIRMDNRDSGLSSSINQSESLRDEQPAYRLEDMASDVNTVLQSAQIPSAHIMGISLDGMIGQVFASKYPDKTLSLISVSSTTGKSGLKLGPAMTYLQEPPAPTRELRVRQFIKLYPHFAGKRYPMTQQEMEHRARADLSNDDPLAAARQGMAAGVSGDRTPLLSAEIVPRY